MFKSTTSLFAFALTATLLATGCAGTVNEQGSTAATASAAMSAAEDEAPESETKPAAELINANEVTSITGYTSYKMPTEPKRTRFIAQTGPGDTATVAYVAYAAPAMFTDTQAGAASQNLRVAPVAGLSKGAYFESTRNILYVRVPGHTLLVGAPIAPQPGRERRTEAVQIARLAVSRMKQQPQ